MTCSVCVIVIAVTDGIYLRLVRVASRWSIALAKAPRITRIRDGTVREALAVHGLRMRRRASMRAIEGHAVAVTTVWRHAGRRRLARGALRRSLSRRHVREGLLRGWGHRGEGRHAGASKNFPEVCPVGGGVWGRRGEVCGHMWRVGVGGPGGRCGGERTRDAYSGALSDFDNDWGALEHGLTDRPVSSRESARRSLTALRACWLLVEVSTARI